ncbi:MAG: alanine racemase [Firmicutes bacterium]|nr:alanine racemase [Bacillota bacterium]
MKILDTPCIVVNRDRMQENIRKMQEAANDLGCVLRPHIKTHKSVEIAKMQLAAGAVGITCAKTSEAEIFAEGGINDIFIAYPLIGESKLMRALTIQRQVDRLILAVDSIEGARALSKFAIQQGTTFEVRIEIDTGLKRTGTANDKLHAIGVEIKNLPCIEVTGVYTFKSLLYKNEATADVQAAGEEEGELIKKAADLLHKLGLNIRDISAGSTPTGLSVAKTGLVNEIRPGTYVFYDWSTWLQGVCSEDNIAACVIATVVSTPSDTHAVIDAGVKTLAADVRLNMPTLPLTGFARITGRDDLILDRLSEEHGMIRAANGGETGLKVGEVLKLIPAHICPVINLKDYFYVQENGDFRKARVDARGRVW